MAADYPQTRTFELGNGVILEMVLIPAGTFMMGSPASEAERSRDETQHQVTISKPFYLGKYPITQAQWQQVMGTNPSLFKGDKLLPVDNVSCYGIQGFCLKLKDITQAHFGIPTEAQWEYACRSLTTSAYHFGNHLNGTLANCDGNYPYGTDNKGPYLEGTTPVGKYPANAWGLHDMHGNVWEWCADLYGEYHSEYIDIHIGDYNIWGHVLCGGAWNCHAKRCCAHSRLFISSNPPFSFDGCGGRVFLPLDS